MWTNGVMYTVEDAVFSKLGIITMLSGLTHMVFADSVGITKEILLPF